MSNTTRALTDRLTAPDETGLDPSLLVPLLTLLAKGKPVEVADLATASDLSADDVRRTLAAVPDTEYDELGRIVGQGLTLRPTRHRFAVGGQDLYTWCALDTLVFPILLGQSATIESVSPTSDTTIRVRADATQLVSVEPATAVVSLVNPEDMTAIRSSFCNQVHYFASAEDAQPWLDKHPEAELLPVAEAYQLGATLTRSMSKRSSTVR